MSGNCTLSAFQADGGQRRKASRSRLINWGPLRLNSAIAVRGFFTLLISRRLSRFKGWWVITRMKVSMPVGGVSAYWSFLLAVVVWGGSLALFHGGRVYDRPVAHHESGGSRMCGNLGCSGHRGRRARHRTFDNRGNAERLYQAWRSGSGRAGRYPPPPPVYALSRNVFLALTGLRGPSVGVMFPV